MLEGLVVEVTREREIVLVNATVARSRFFLLFFRSRERGEIKSDCNHCDNL